MLLDDEEIEIMAGALQPRLRVQEPDTLSRSILEMFFAGQQFAGTKIIEIGPGQHDFARLVTAAGANVLTIDHDPAVVALGRKRGYEAIHGDVLNLDWRPYRGRFDGLFVRNSIAPQWFRDPPPLQEFIDVICSILKPTGWGWVVPWNRFARSDVAYIERMVDAQRQAFERNGFTTMELTELTACNGGAHDHWDLFLRGLHPAIPCSDSHSLRRYT